MCSVQNVHADRALQGFFFLQGSREAEILILNICFAKLPEATSDGLSNT